MSLVYINKDRKYKGNEILIPLFVIHVIMIKNLICLENYVCCFSSEEKQTSLGVFNIQRVF